MKSLRFVFLVIFFLSVTINIAKADKSMWLTSACYKFHLAVWDKFSEKEFTAKYTVISKRGRIYIAEKRSTDSNSSRVIFPDDFKEAKNGLRAYVNCFEGEEYSWNIYANNVLIDSGTIFFKRNLKAK